MFKKKFIKKDKDLYGKNKNKTHKFLCKDIKLSEQTDRYAIFLDEKS